MGGLGQLTTVKLSEILPCAEKADREEGVESQRNAESSIISRNRSLWSSDLAGILQLSTTITAEHMVVSPGGTIVKKTYENNLRPECDRELTYWIIQ